MHCGTGHPRLAHWKGESPAGDPNKDLVKDGTEACPPTHSSVEEAEGISSGSKRFRRLKCRETLSDKKGIGSACFRTQHAFRRPVRWPATDRPGASWIKCSKMVWIVGPVKLLHGAPRKEHLGPYRALPRKWPNWGRGRNGGGLGFARTGKTACQLKESSHVELRPAVTPLLASKRGRRFCKLTERTGGPKAQGGRGPFACFG